MLRGASAGLQAAARHAAAPAMRTDISRRYCQGSSVVVPAGLLTVIHSIHACATAVAVVCLWGLCCLAVPAPAPVPQPTLRHRAPWSPHWWAHKFRHPACRPQHSCCIVPDDLKQQQQRKGHVGQVCGPRCAYQWQQGNDTTARYAADQDQHKRHHHPAPQAHKDCPASASAAPVLLG